jgi:HEAT repeat protein
MTIYPNLTISLLSQLTDRELQSNYLNHLDRTSEIASLLAQITDSDLALRIVNLALEVDLSLGASLTGSIDPELQKVVVDGIDRLEIPTTLKIELWYKTKSKAALPYLQDIFIFKHRQPDDRNGERTISSAIATISCIDRDLGIALLIEDLSDSRWHHNAAEHLSRLASGEEIELLAPLLKDKYLTSEWDSKHLAIEALERIGTDEAINKIREILEDRSLWLQTSYTYALGIVADPAMVEHLIYLLYEPELYIHRSIEYPESEEYYANEADHLCCAAIEALERIGQKNVNVFGWLHQSLYWISNVDEFHSPFQKIVRALFKLDRDRILTALEGAIKSYDPIVRKRAVMALAVWDVPICDRNLIILLNALNDSELDVHLEVVCSIRDIISKVFYTIGYEANITPELLNRAILKTKPILIKWASHPDLEIRDRVIDMLLGSEPDERELIVKLLGDVRSTYAGILDGIRSVPIEPKDLPVLLTYLKYDSVDLRAGVARNIGKTRDDSIVPILLELIRDPEQEIRDAAIASIIELGSEAIFSTVLELAANPELVATLIFELRKLADENANAAIFNNFHRDRNVTLEFIETAEQTSVYNIRSKTHHVNGEIFALLAIGDELGVTALQEILETNDSYDDIDQAVLSLAKIGTEHAMSVLLSFLPDLDIFYGWIAIQFHNLGKLGLIPHLWSAERQIHSYRGSELITTIQEREGLYNPDFSDRSHPLFESPHTRLRHILLGDTELSGIK